MSSTRAVQLSSDCKFRRRLTQKPVIYFVHVFPVCYSEVNQVPKGIRTGFAVAFVFSVIEDEWATGEHPRGDRQLETEHSQPRVIPVLRATPRVFRSIFRVSRVPFFLPLSYCVWLASCLDSYQQCAEASNPTTPLRPPLPTMPTISFSYVWVFGKPFMGISSESNRSPMGVPLEPLGLSWESMGVSWEDGTTK